MHERGYEIVDWDRYQGSSHVISRFRFECLAQVSKTTVASRIFMIPDAVKNFPHLPFLIYAL